MKKFIVMILAAVMLLSMVPVSAIEYVATSEEDISGVIQRSEATSITWCDFTITGSLAKVKASYAGTSTFSYAKVYLYIQKNVNGTWVAARDDTKCSWYGTYYESINELSASVTLTSRGQYRGRAVMYIYSTQGTHDKWDLNKEKTY